MIVDCIGYKATTMSSTSILTTHLTYRHHIHHGLYIRWKKNWQKEISAGLYRYPNYNKRHSYTNLKLERTNFNSSSKLPNASKSQHTPIKSQIRRSKHLSNPNSIPRNKPNQKRQKKKKSSSNTTHMKTTHPKTQLASSKKKNFTGDGAIARLPAAPKIITSPAVTGTALRRRHHPPPSWSTVSPAEGGKFPAELGLRRRSPESDLGVGETVVEESTDLGGGDVRVRGSTIFTS